MTPQERAEKIVGPNIDGNKYHDAKINLVASQIEEACEEARQEGWRQRYKTTVARKAYDGELDKRYAEGWNAAREKAMGIVKGSLPTDYALIGKAIADRIAKMEPEK